MSMTKFLSIDGSILRWLLCGLFALTIFAPHRAEAWWNTDWSYRSKITIAGAQAGGPAADVTRMPVLVRLHDGNFKFTDAKEDGSDLRFVDGDDKTPLKFHIESYDSLLGMAFIWVDVPIARGGAPTDFYVYHGNANASAGADPRGSYDADTALVYHFAERNAPPHDQTANDNTGTSPAKSTDSGLIGRAAHFDGATIVGLPGSPSLAVQPGGALTWSAWIKPAGPSSGSLYVKRDGANALVIGLDQGKPYVAITANGAETRGAAPEALAPATWHHIAVTTGAQATLYVDGKPVATAAAALPALAAAASLGGESAAAGSNYSGDLDELEISRIARSPAFIQAAVANEGPDSKMLNFGQPEENAGMSGGYFGVILRSVTIDGWVVIAILAVMALVSFTVMANKTWYINRVAGANRKFLALFEQAGTDVGRLKMLLSANRTQGLGNSVLYRVCDAGMDELAKRENSSGIPVLSSQAVASIRARLDRVSTYESQRLNAMMVLLTIAISGGPFLGLLGTVVGVMITFAAIAASGDVNINAIAPGIAAALVATVAGLAVAIPALFGYNYLISRIKDITSQMHVFTDELVTRLAEAYPPRADAARVAGE